MTDTLKNSNLELAWTENHLQGGPAPFDVQYRTWTKLRLDTLVTELGEEWFILKRILEVGSGHGWAVRTLKKLGAREDSVITDGREAYMKILREAPNENLRAYVMDQDKPWKIEEGELGKFDLIIHWGVNYHLTNWKEDIISALKHSDLICFETDLCEIDDPDYEAARAEVGNDQSIHEIATLVSQPRLENFLTSLGCEFKRIDSPLMDFGSIYYSWKTKPKPTPEEDPDYSPSNPKYLHSGKRRFYMIRKSAK